jgi:hypothetical protein
MDPEWPLWTADILSMVPGPSEFYIGQKSIPSLDDRVAMVVASFDFTLRFVLVSTAGAGRGSTYGRLPA